MNQPDKDGHIATDATAKSPPGDSASPVRFTADGAIGRLILARPRKRNAVSPEMAAGLEAALDELERDPELRVGVISGDGDAAFSAGADLTYVARGEAALLSTRRGGFAGVTRYPRRKPLIAAVHGYALGGGFEIALACDLIVAERSAQFGLPEVTRGLIANGGGVLRLAAILPRPRALDLILTGRRIGTAEAAEMGLITRVVDDGQAVPVALSLAAAIAASPPGAVQESLYLANTAARAPSEELWTLCAEIAGRIRRDADAIEGASAFLDRRAASWSRE